MEMYFVKYKGTIINVHFKTLEEAEDFCMNGFERKIDALMSWAKDSKFEKQYLRDLDDYFGYEIIKGRIEWAE